MSAPSERPALARLRDDERGFIISWLAKLAIGFVVVGILVFDGGSILINFFTLDSTADEIAIKLTTGDFGRTLNKATLTREAEELAKEAGARLVDLTVDGNLVLVTLRRRADTLVVGRIGWISDWARATAEGRSRTG